MNHAVQSHQDFVKFRLKVGDEEFDKLVQRPVQYESTRKGALRWKPFGCINIVS